MRRLVIVMVVWMAVLKTVAASPAPPAQIVGEVRVFVNFGAALSETLRPRIEASVAKVAERIMLGRPIAMAQEKIGENERTIRDIFGRILTGYRIDGLIILPGAETRIIITLVPDGPIVNRVDVAVDVPGLNEDGVKIVREALQSRQEDFTRILSGIPVKAFDWAATVLTPALQQVIDEEAPGYRPSIAFEPGETLGLKVSLVAMQPAVESVAVSMDSTTLPHFITGMWRKQALETLGGLKGLPVAFLRHHQLRLEETGGQKLSGDPSMLRFGLQCHLRLYPGSAVRARFFVDAVSYSFTAHGRLDVIDQPALELVLRAGYRPLPDWEFAGQVALATDGAAPNWSGSLSYAFSSELAIGFTRSIDLDEHFLWLRYGSGRGDVFILGGDLVSGDFKASIGLMNLNELGVMLTVDSNRDYQLTVEMAL